MWKKFWLRISKMLVPGIFNFNVGILAPIDTTGGQMDESYRTYLILNYSISKFGFVELLNRLWMRNGTVWADSNCISGKLETSGLWEPVYSHHHLYRTFFKLKIPSKVPISTKNYAKWSLDAQTSNFWTWWWSIEFKREYQWLSVSSCHLLEVNYWIHWFF